ncbi:uncharacterized mitochondrial protein-like protein [Tanacetum coccineum]|uniref:Uncharacterized mitochondrial protein-like protein n=1 Tax=Tanacetum coccineum TaxID=301880 RepID=A0ABQ5B613_9ASTR
MFDEYFKPPSDVSIKNFAATLPPPNIVGASSSTSIDQDAPSPSTSTNNEITTFLINSINVEELHNEEEAVFDSDTFTNPFAPSVTSSAESSSRIFLVSQQFIKDAVDPTLFTRKEGEHIILVQIYVNDIIFASINPSFCDKFADQMSKHFKISMMGKMSFFLGLQIFQSPTGIFINQSKYTLEMLKKYSLDHYDPVDIPMVERLKLDEDPNGTLVDPTRYRDMVGSLMYLTASRPDLVFAVCMCIGYQAKPTKKHLIIVKRVFRYLKGTKSMGLWYPKDTGFNLTAFADANHAGCQDSRKSTSDSA